MGFIITDIHSGLYKIPQQTNKLTNRVTGQQQKQERKRLDEVVWSRKTDS